MLHSVSTNLISPQSGEILKIMKNRDTHEIKDFQKYLSFIR